MAAAYRNPPRSSARSNGVADRQVCRASQDANQYEETWRSVPTRLPLVLARPAVGFAGLGIREGPILGQPEGE